MFGFWGEVFYVASILPCVNLEQAAKALEEQLGYRSGVNGTISAYAPHAIRAFKLDARQTCRSVLELESAAFKQDARLFVLRLRRDGLVQEADEDTTLETGDVVVLAGLLGKLTQFGASLGAEVDDAELLT